MKPIIKRLLESTKNFEMTGSTHTHGSQGILIILISKLGKIKAKCFIVIELQTLFFVEKTSKGKKYNIIEFCKDLYNLSDLKNEK